MNVKIRLSGASLARPMGVALSGLVLANGVVAEEGEVTKAASDPVTLEAFSVVAEREARTSRGATGLNLSIKNTPQSVSVVEQEFIENFQLTDVNSVLDLSTGVNVERVETDRTYYNSRGFDIKSMQVDSIGLPFNWNVIGALDTVLYEKVEIIRGANGLLTGTGNPSGTINFVRKRPTNDTQASVKVSAGEWDRVRAEADVSTPFSETGDWAGRVVVAAQDGDSYLDNYANERQVFYGVIDGQLTDNTMLAAGYTYQKNRSEGILWGGLTYLYSDGSQAEYDVSASTSMDWTYWETENKTAFVELTTSLGRGWELKTVLTHNEYEEPSELFYTYTFPALDQETGLGLYGYPGKYLSDSERIMLDITLSGEYEVAGRYHQLLVGMNASRANNGYLAYPAAATDPAWGALPSFPGWDGTEVARPDFGDSYKAGDWEDKYKRLYAVTNINATDKLDLILGFNAVDVQSTGYSFDDPMDRDEKEISPYVGVVYAFNPRLNGYASYSDIFEPQTELKEQDGDLEPLGSAQGKSYEVGMKADLIEGRLLGSVALFESKQDNYASFVGTDMETGFGIYEGIEIESDGVEAEVTGKLQQGWLIKAGYTKLDLEGADGEEARTFVPRRTFKLGTQYELPFLSAVEVGATVKWQDEIYLETAAGTIRQKSYAVYDAFVSYAATDNLEFALNLKNLSDEKYITSLYWEQAHYGAPRNAMASVKWSY